MSDRANEEPLYETTLFDAIVLDIALYVRGLLRRHDEAVARRAVERETGKPAPERE